MKFASTRLVAADIKSMVSFYEKVTGQSAEWLAPVFADPRDRERRDDRAVQGGKRRAGREPQCDPRVSGR